MWEDRAWQDNGKSGLDALPMLPTDFRLWAVMAALRRGISPEEIAQRSWYRPMVSASLSENRGDGTPLP